MTTQPFARRLTRTPLAHDHRAAAEAGAAFADLGAKLSGLLAATAGCSPYLAGLMQHEGAWLRTALRLAPETVLPAILTPLDDLPLAALSAGLRQAKRRTALLAALADLGGVWGLAQVTGALTALADRAVDLCVRRLVAEEIRRGRLPGAQTTDAGTGAGMVVLAMGKMGARELNYSSDIDLVCLFDDARYPGQEQVARAAFIRVTRAMTALLSDHTAEGYVFRTDLRLRPDAAVTPVCLSMTAAETYYESQGRSWERAAYIKARPCGGDLAAGARFLRALTPFVWRRHLDFAAIQDAHDMRLRIRDHRGLNGPLRVEGHDLKLGAGGIREIEFFTQTRQLIAGGRDPDLRDPTTTGALAALARKGWLPSEVATALTTAYAAHREVEHRLQMVGDAQTHRMPATPEGIDRIARFSGFADSDAFRETLLARLGAVQGLIDGFFVPGPADPLPEMPEAARAVVGRWQAYPALRSDRAQAIFTRLAPVILTRLMQAGNVDEALSAFDGFLRGLPSGVQIFSLFDANPPLVDLIVDIAATSPLLAGYLSRNATVLDAVIGGAFFAPWPGMAALRDELAAVLAAAGDYERQLDAARRWQKEVHFRIGVHHLRGLIDAVQAGKEYADLAEAVVAALWPVVAADLAARHGPAPGRGAVVVGMGSLGAGRLTAGSDLDLIVIYDAMGEDASSGPRPLPSRAYFARATQALVTALSAPTAEGRLYDVDMRLRPSGRQGPVATALAAFRAYQQDEAWTWEHLALTQARVLAGDPGLGVEVEGFRRALIRAKGQGATVLADAADMRARLAAARPASGLWEARNGPGRLMDIALFAQTMALRCGDPSCRPEAHLRAAVRAGLLDLAEEETLLAAYRLCWRLRAGTRLLTDRVLDPATLGRGGCAFLLRETGCGTVADLSARLDTVTTAAARVIDARLGPGGMDDAAG